MIEINNVFQFNIPGTGYKLIWTKSDTENILSTEEFSRYFPNPLNEIFGPNITFNISRLNNNKFFFISISRWNINDEHGRPGLTLAQGILISIKDEEPDLIIKLCEYFLGITTLHKQLYSQLGMLLERIVQTSDIEPLEKLFRKMSSEKLLFSFLNTNLIKLLNELLKKNLDKFRDPCRFYITFPWSEEAAICAICCLQINSLNNLAIGGGYLSSFENFYHIFSIQELPSFKSISFNEYLDQIKVLNNYEDTKPISNIQSNLRKVSINNEEWVRIGYESLIERNAIKAIEAFKSAINNDSEDIIVFLFDFLNQQRDKLSKDNSIAWDRIYRMLLIKTQILPEQFRVKLVTLTERSKPTSKNEISGFNFILDKSIESALKAFSNAISENPQDLYLQSIRAFLIENNSLISSDDDQDWNKVYANLLKQFSRGMPESIIKKFVKKVDGQHASRKTQ